MKLAEFKKQLKGISLILQTPFNADGSVDIEGMRFNVRWMLKFTKGKDFVYSTLGSGGEFYALSEQEQRDVINTVIAEVNGQHPVVVGGGRAGTLETVRICKFAQSAGADGALVVLPYYHIPQEEGMYVHFKTLAESVDPDFGLIVYNNSGATGSWVKPHLMKRLSKIPNIVGLKENTGEFGAFYSMMRAIDPADTVILTGIGELMYSVEAAYGVVGLFSSMAGFAPELAWDVYEAGSSKDYSRLNELINTRVWPYFEFRARTNVDHGPNTSVPGAGGGLAGSQYISVIKAGMEIRGLRAGAPRLPLLPLTEKEKAEMRDVVKAMKLP